MSSIAQADKGNNALRNSGHYNNCFPAKKMNVAHEILHHFSVLYEGGMHIASYTEVGISLHGIKMHEIHM